MASYNIRKFLPFEDLKVLIMFSGIRKELGMRFFLLEIATHGVNSCLVLVEVLATRMPVRLLHMYQPLGVGLSYPIFSIIYYCAGGTDMYDDCLKHINNNCLSQLKAMYFCLPMGKAETVNTKFFFCFQH